MLQLDIMNYLCFCLIFRSLEFISYLELKIVMKHQVIPFILILCLPVFLSAQQNKPIVEFYTTTISGKPGDTVCLPVKVREFRDVLGVGLGLRWNANALQFLEVRTLGYAIGDNTAANYGLTNVENGDIKWTWISENFPQGRTLDDDETLFELCFVLSESGAGGFYSLSFDSGFVSPEVILDDNLYADPIATANYVPGGIFIKGDNTIELLPNFQFALDCGAYISLINPSPLGGQPPYRYTWVGSQAFFSNAQSINAPRAGLYYLTVTDQNGDIARAEIRVDYMGNQAGLEKPQVNAEVNHPDCGQANGSIDITVDDPLAYQFVWSTGDTTEDLSNIPSGNYNLIVIRENNCTDTLDFTLSAQGAISLDVVQDTIGCRGDTARIGITNLTGDFDYSWSTGDTLPLLSVTIPGDYSLTVSDGSCVRIENFTVIEESNPPNPNNFILLENNLACDDTSATIGVTYFGLRPDLRYQWSTGDTTDQIQVTEIGLYTLDIAGADGCPISFSFEVLQDDPNLPFEQEITFQGCLIGETRLAMIPQDGRQYDFIWSTAETTSAISVDSASTYTVTVTETLSSCGQTFVFDAEDIGDPTKAAIDLSIDCGIAGNCYSGTTLYINVQGAAEPVQYTWSDGTIEVGRATDTLNIYSLLPLDLYIQDADGCTDTLRNLLADCQQNLAMLDLNARQYVVCETDPETAETATYVYTEVLNSAGLPPYVFYWGNGVVDTSYYRSRQLLDSLPNLFISITDQVGNRFDRQIPEAPASYACGDENTPVFSASDTIVAPGTSFTYPLFIENHEGVERVIYTIDWDPCLVRVDSMTFYDAEGVALVDRNILSGTYEASFFQEGGSQSGDPFLAVELHCRANTNVEGVSPFLFSINELATDSNGTAVLLRPRHGSIVVSQDNDLILPGDANLNSQIDHKDLLNIGLAYQATGPDRREQQVSRRDYAFSWLRQTPQTAVDYKHIDGNGDGRINAQDLMAIDQNFNYVPNSAPESGGSGAALLFAADTLYIGQRATFPVLLGSETMSADSVYGLAFSLRYDPTVIDESTIAVDFSESWLMEGTTPLTYLRVDPENQLIHLALSRTDQQNVSGGGAVAQISFAVISADTLNTTFQTLDATLISAEESLIPITTGSSEAVVQLTTNIQAMAQRSRQVRIFPNPVQDQLYLQAEDLDMQAYRLYDSQGRQVQNGPITTPVLNMQHLPGGLYWLQIMTDRGLVRKRLLVQGTND